MCLRCLDISSPWLVIMPCRYLYGNGYVHEPNPKDVSFVHDHAKRMCQKDQMLPAARTSMVYGVFAKTHLVTFLQALDMGMRWEHDSSTMTPRLGDAELAEHLQHGMFMEVIAWEAVEKYPDKVNSLMRSNNLDQSFSMPEHEVAMLYKMFECAHEAPSLAPGQPLWQMV